MKILHIITGLERGGAETLLFQFCKYDEEYDHIVISLSGSQDYGIMLRQIKIPLHTLNFSNSKVNLRGLYQLYKLVKKIKPDVIQTWMVHADIIGGLVGRLAGIKNIFWGVHHSALVEGKSKKTTMLIIKINALLSYFIPKKIIYCAENSREKQESIGFKKNSGVVIFNGYNTEIFNENFDFIKKFRDELNISDNTFLIGHVGSYSPLKDQINLIEALSILKQKHIDFKAVLVGSNLDKNNLELVSAIDKKELSDSIYLLGRRDDIPTIMNGIDLFILSSISEAFPNVLNEAMACGTPCVSTNVGDASYILGETGWIVPTKDPKALSESVSEAIIEKFSSKSLWLHRKKACRERIVENFSLVDMIQKYKDVWLNG